MRSALLVSLAVFLVVVTGGYCINWFVQAHEAKAGLEQAIATLNTHGQNGQPLLQYQAIETSGFPKDVIVTLVKPHFAGRIDQLINAATQQPAQPQWFIDTSLDGSVSFSVNALSNHYSMTINGNWQSVNTVGDQTLAISSQAAGPTTCVMDMAHGGGLFGALWTFSALHKGDAFLRDLRMLDCNTPAYTVVDPQTQAKLMSAAGGRFYVTSEPKDKRAKFRIYAKASDMETTEAGNKLIKDFTGAVFPGSVASSMTVTGKQNLELDFSYDGPSDAAGASSQPLDAFLSKFSLENPLYTADATMHLINNPSGANIDGSLVLKANQTFSDAYDAMLQQTLRGMIASCPAKPTPQCQELAAAMPKATPDEMFAVMSPAVPRLHGLGQLTQSVDAAYKGSPDFRNGSLNLTDLTLAATPYGVSAKGTAQTSSAALVPTANMTLTCTNCIQLIDDATAYGLRVQKATQTLNPALPATIDPVKMEGYKKFLTALAGTDSKDFSFAVVSGSGGVSVNGKGIDQVMMLYNQYCGKQPAQK